MRCGNTLIWHGRLPFVEVHLWHDDPSGRDDGCGWFMRAHHGDPKVLDLIVKRFGEDWDRTWTDKEGDEADGRRHLCGMFTPAGWASPDDPGGTPLMSTHGIVLHLFAVASITVFGSRKKAMRFLQRHLAEILWFAENPFDSLHGAIVQKWGPRMGRGASEERKREVASLIYGWILRARQPWWRHPKAHVHHWRFEFNRTSAWPYEPRRKPVAAGGGR